MDQQRSQRTVETFMKEQPALGIFITAKAEQVEGGPHQCHSIDLCMAAWMAFSNVAGRRLNTISPEQIEALDDANMQALTSLDEDSEMAFFEAARSLVQSYNQAELIGFALEVLMSGNEDAPELAPESIGLELITVKTVIDSLDQHG